MLAASTMLGVYLAYHFYAVAAMLTYARLPRVAMTAFTTTAMPIQQCYHCDAKRSLPRLCKSDTLHCLVKDGSTDDGSGSGFPVQHLPPILLHLALPSAYPSA